MTTPQRTPRASAAKKTLATQRAVPRQAAKPPAAAPAPSTKPKQKLVRDSFTIPKAEYAVLEALKVRAADLKRPTKKSELLRAGVAALNAMGDKAFLAALSTVPSLKTGRPKKAQGKTAAAS